MHVHKYCIHLYILYIYTYTHVHMYTCTGIQIYTYTYIHIRRALQSVERVRLHTTPPSLEHPATSRSKPSKQGPAEDISPASSGSHAVRIEESYAPGTQAAGIRDVGRLPTPGPENPANLLQSMLLPAQDCQIAYLGTLAAPVDPKLHPGVAADTKGGRSPPKCD